VQKALILSNLQETRVDETMMGNDVGRWKEKKNKLHKNWEWI
jgi:hypothetical protein